MDLCAPAFNSRRPKSKRKRHGGIDMAFNSALIKAILPGLALTIALLAVAGCSKKDSGADSGSGAASAASGGAAIFAANCANCHSINGTGGKRAPDLSHVGADSEHTVDWLTAFIKNPQSKKPGTRMPGFDGKISDADLQTLATYLAGLK
jgi:mono/diheme cytochrome c family protein